MFRVNSLSLQISKLDFRSYAMVGTTMLEEHLPTRAKYCVSIKTQGCR